jgi:hypothetical protein
VTPNGRLQNCLPFELDVPARRADDKSVLKSTRCNVSRHPGLSVRFQSTIISEFVKGTELRFSSQDLPDVENASAEFIARAFDEKAIGKFAHLWLSNDVVIFAGSKGKPSNCLPPDDPLVKERWAFIQRTGSEPWTLRYIDGIARKEYQAQGDLTLEQVKTAFIEYLRTDGQ